MTVFFRKRKLNCCQSGKKFYVEFSPIYVGLQLGLKVKLCFFTYNLLFNAFNMLSALRLTYLTCRVGHGVTESTRTWSLDDVKTHYTHTFSSTKLLTRVTVADKLVLVNPF